MQKSFGSPLEFKRISINAKVISHELIEPEGLLKSKYVEYTIKINTHYKCWLVKRRYSNFEDLHKSLSNKINYLPKFPPKRIFKNAETTIKERKNMFESYLNFLFKNLNVFAYQEILDFIEMEGDLLNLFFQSNNAMDTGASIAVNKYFFSMKKSSNNFENPLKRARSVEISIENEKAKKNYYNTFLEFKMQLEERNDKSSNMLVIEEFLRNLEQKYENKIEIIKTFEQFLKSKKNWPNLKKEEIIKLLNGDPSSVYSAMIASTSPGSIDSDLSLSKETNLKGLMYHVGSIDQNILGAEACLEFLGKLIDYEFNPECEAYIYVLKTSKIEHIVGMKLHEHMFSQRNIIVIIAFRIVSTLINDDKNYESKIKKLIIDERALNKFIQWYENNKFV